MTKTPEQIAADQRDAFEIRDGDVQDTSWSRIESVIAAAVEADRMERDRRIREFFRSTVHANGLAARSDTLAALEELSERIRKEFNKSYETRQELLELTRQRDAVRAFLGTGEAL